MAQSPTVASRPSVVSSTLAANRLGIMHVVFFVITAAAPLTVIAGIVSTGWQVTEIKGLPLAFLLVAVVLALFCVGYVAVARRIRNAGAFYTYIAKGLGKPLGVGGSFIALFAYGLMQWSTYGAIGFTLSTLVHDKTGATVPWYVFGLAAWALVAIMGLLRVDLNSRVLAVALVAEVVVVVIFDIIDVAHPFGGSVSFTTLSPASLSGAGLGIALAIAVTGFIGFEAAAVFSEESKESDRTVPAATFLSLALMAVLYAGSAWAMAVTIGADNLHKAATQFSSTLPAAVVATKVGGNIVIDIGQILFATSLIAAALSYHGTCSRYTFALGRAKGCCRPSSAGPAFVATPRNMPRLRRAR
ncbi:APC family permease [Fodinicola feengrottensis]|uniref:APC family permease n=1 Tax=Fodinicola feengrottensis TaxID=435914 RepID=UPI002442EBC1|nr:APC family permease [Fodinicola feengrottensis]